MTSTTFDPAPCDAVGSFLADYTSLLQGCGATCVRIEKNVRRIAETYGYTADLTILPRHVSVGLTAADGSGGCVLFSRPIRPCGINFDLNSELSALSWHIADRHPDIGAASARFAAIASHPYGESLHILLMTSLANASFCRLFGGDAVAMAVVFGATFAGYTLKQTLMRCRVDVRVIFFCCALLSSGLSAGARLFGWGTTPDIALATSVLYLIPGVPYINAASDLIDKHYLCSFSRLADAVVLTASLSAGLCAGLYLTGMSLL